MSCRHFSNDKASCKALVVFPESLCYITNVGTFSIACNAVLLYMGGMVMSSSFAISSSGSVDCWMDHTISATDISWDVSMVSSTLMKSWTVIAGLTWVTSANLSNRFDTSFSSSEGKDCSSLSSCPSPSSEFARTNPACLMQFWFVDGVSSFHEAAAINMASSKDIFR